MAHTGISEWRWLWQEVRPFVRYQAASLLCILSASFVSLVDPLIMKWLIDDILPQRRLTALPVAAVLFFSVYVGRLVLSSLASVITFLAVQRLTYGLRVRLLDHLQALSGAFYAEHPVGDLVQRMERDVEAVGDLGADVVPSIVRMVVMSTFTVTTMLILDWRLTSLVVPLLPLFVFVRYRYRMILRRVSDQVREAMGRQSSLLNELLTGVLQIQLLGAERRLSRRYARLNLRTMRVNMVRRRAELWFTLFSMSVIALGMSLIIGIGGARVIFGGLTAGSLVAFYSYIGYLFSPLTTAVELYARLNRVRASIRRLQGIEDTPSLIADAPDAVPIVDAPQQIVCRNVTFGYAPGQPVLHGIDFVARAGERVAIVGASGCGKSSLLKLMPRLYDVETGSVTIDGLDVRRAQIKSLRRAISVVPQEPVLLQGTLRDNLLHARPAASRADLARVARLACLTEVVDRLPGGWDAPLGPMGAGLSGGEKQRVAIARALLQERPVVILDEATSALDPPTEQRLLAHLDTWCSGRIVVVVTHRLSAACWADRIVVLVRGQLVEQGSHDTLFRPGTAYHQLWQRQSDERLPDADRAAARLEHSPVAAR
jgi:ABC-type bacteriocin/lantibiotic exporter with double-glycine peptidase domain